MFDHHVGFIARSLALMGFVAALSGCSSSNHPAPPEGSPAAPTDLTGTQVRWALQLDWVDSSDDETSFEIYKTGGGKDWHRVAGVAANVTRYVDGNLGSDQHYIWVVKAKNDKGESRPTNRVELRTPKAGGKPRGPDGSCGLILSESGLGARRPTAASSGPMNSLCLFSAGKRIGVEDVQEFGTTGGEVLLRGRQGDAVLARIQRRRMGDIIYFDADVEWRNPPSAENWEVCLAVHDATSTDIRRLMAQQGVSAWLPKHVRVPVLDRLPIVAERSYAVGIAIDTKRARYSVHLDGMPLALNIALDRILVMPAVVRR